MSLPLLAPRQRSSEQAALPAPLKRYLDLCAAYSTQPSADVTIWLRLLESSALQTPPLPVDLDMARRPPRLGQRGWRANLACDCRAAMPGGGFGEESTGTAASASATLVIQPPFADMDLLPLCDLLTEEPTSAQRPLDGLRSLDLSRCRIRRSGVLMLCRTVLAHHNCQLVTLNLDHQSVGSTGARALATAARGNHALKELLLHNCWLRDEGGLIFARLLDERPRSHGLTLLDLSNNAISMQTCLALESAARREEAGRSVTLNVDGNRILDEVLNASSHGVAFLLAVIGVVFLGIEVSGRPASYVWAVTIYLISLCTLFLSSTLYHSFFSLKTTRMIFSIFDHAAIFLLIAGSYTPLLAIIFPDEPLYSRGFLVFMWVACVVGIATTAIMREGRAKAMLLLSLYLGMGWVAVLITGQLVERVSPAGLQLLVGGGLFYTLGVPFFIKNRQTLGVPDHTIWHLFVLVGAASHYVLILRHIVPVAAPPMMVRLPPPALPPEPDF